MVDNPSYVDINIFVYWLGNHPEFGETAYKWIKKIENSQRGKYVTSSLTLYETLVIIAGLAGKSLKDKAFTEKIIASITHIKGLAIEPLKPEDFTKAVELMEDYKLDYEDSIHLAVAIRTGAHEILSNDKDFDATPIKRSI
jgi:predicted nucleic acid-binding protein